MIRNLGFNSLAFKGQNNSSKYNIHSAPGDTICIENNTEKIFTPKLNVNYIKETKDSGGSCFVQLQGYDDKLEIGNSGHAVAEALWGKRY